jgi:hypothetical protein
VSQAADPIRALAKLIPRATRAALEETFWYWLREIAPAHFRRDAFGRYEEYADSAKRDETQWRQRHARDLAKGFSRDVSPLKATGALERAFLSGTVTFTGSNLRLTARWLRLPAYAGYRNRYSGFQPFRALTDLSEADRVTLERLFREWLNRNITTGEIADKTYGGGVLETDGD